MRKPLAVPLALVLIAVAAPAATAETVTATGFSQVKVVPGNPQNNESIVAAVERAHEIGVPLALASARENATELAAASGLVIGDVESVSDAVFGPYGPGYSGFAPFGPDQYCGTITRRRRSRDSSGRVHTRRVRVRRCYVPRQLPTTLQVTYKATRAG
jgi:hypothetical protein